MFRYFTTPKALCIGRVGLATTAWLMLAPTAMSASEQTQGNIATVVGMPGLVAFWDFSRRESGGHGRFTAHVPAGSPTDYPLEAGNYVQEYWGAGRPAIYEDFPVQGIGPFGAAIRIRKETDRNFRPYLYVPRDRLADTLLDIKGPARSLSVVVWAIRESGNHALAGIWHEGTDLKLPQTEGIRKAESAQRQYGLFAGLGHPGTACGHVSENGVGTFGDKYCWHKGYSAEVSPTVPADSPDPVLQRSWQCFSMTLDHRTQELTSWLNGHSGNVWEDDPRRKARPVYDAWRKTHQPSGKGSGRDAAFAPPEETPVNVQIVAQSDTERTEIREFPYTRVQVVLRRTAKGDFVEVSKDLVALRLNPWWYPHGIYAPPTGSGGPFTIGRVIHSAREVGFTGWIGGVVVFDRALRPEDIVRLAALAP